MAIYKVVTGHKYTMTGVLEYTHDMKKHNDKVLYNGGYGVDPNNPVEDMLFVKQMFNKQGGNDFYHIVVSLEKSEHPELNRMLTFFDEFANNIYITTGCQVSYSIHDNTEHLHCHYIINSVVMADGSKLNFDMKMFYVLRNALDVLLFKYGLQPLKYRVIYKTEYMV